MSTATKVLAALEQVTGTDEVRRNLNLALFDLGLLDSFAFVELLVAVDESCGADISPAEVEREQWATPAKIIAFVESRVGP
jgi:D-alanine--poly(phosphoribitol) ligase subunit 2